MSEDDDNPTDWHLFLCTLCNQLCDSTDRLALVDEKASLNLVDKISKYLPIHLNLEDQYLYCCKNCANVILEFDTIYQKCLKRNSSVNQIEDDHDNNFPRKVLTQDSKGHLEQEGLEEKSINSVESPKCKDFDEVLQILIEPNKVTKQEQNVKDKNKCSKKRQRKDKKQAKGPTLKELNATRIEVDGKLYYSCETCGKKISAVNSFREHLRIHTGERPYVCDSCGKQFRYSRSLLTHTRGAHTTAKDFPCNICGRKFATPQYLRSHLIVHKPERPFPCLLCGKAFKLKATLELHSKTHEGSFPFKCPDCDSKFRRKSVLMLHMLVHTGEKPHVCDVCEKGFRLKMELKNHRLVHSDEFPFSCEKCGLLFRQNRYLVKHARTKHQNVT